MRVRVSRCCVCLWVWVGGWVGGGGGVGAEMGVRAPRSKAGDDSHSIKPVVVLRSEHGSCVCLCVCVGGWVWVGGWVGEGVGVGVGVAVWVRVGVRAPGSTAGDDSHSIKPVVVFRSVHGSCQEVWVWVWMGGWVDVCVRV